MSNNITNSEDGTRQLRDLFRMISIGILIIHFYGYCYPTFVHWGLTSKITDRLAMNFLKIAWFRNYVRVKSVALIALVFSAVGAKTGRSEGSNYKYAIAQVALGGAVYFFCDLLSGLPIAYMVATAVGYFLLLTGFSTFSKIIAGRFLNRDIFNTYNETFPQEERLLENEFSINLPAQYNLRGRRRKSWINIVNPFRGLLILGTPGSGKTFFIVQNIIRQHIQKGFAMFIYDFKYPDLTDIAYKYYQLYQSSYAVVPEFYVIDFDNPMHRCNPIDVRSMNDVTDAAESARTILLGLNHSWISKQGDFWVESPISLLTALIWYLRLYEGGRYCTLAHAIELLQVPYDKLFSVLRAEPQVEALIIPFVTAYLNDAEAQLEGQVSGATISLGKLSSPNLYYVLSGNDFTLDINDPEKPKIVCVGNSPQKANIYGATLSLYITELKRQLNKRDKLKCSIIFDEFPTIYFNGVDNLLATARSNKVATILAAQDASQLKLHYGNDQADVIINIVGNIISGQVSGGTARNLAERFGKILQEKQSISVNDQKSSVTNSTHLDMAIPSSTISSLSSGEFVGMVADNPGQKILLKKFHCEIINKEPTKKEKQFEPKKLQHTTVDKKLILDNYLQIKKDIQFLIESEMERILNDPALESLIVKKV